MINVEPFRASASSARVNCKQRQPAPSVGGDVDDQFGGEPRLDGEARRVGGCGNCLVQLGRGHRGEMQRARGDERSERLVLQRPVKEVGANGGDDFAADASDRRPAF